MLFGIFDEEFLTRPRPPRTSHIAETAPVRWGRRSRFGPWAKQLSRKLWSATKILVSAPGGIRRPLGKIDESTRKVLPMIDRPIRASDQERESVVGVLRDAYTDGRLTMDEFQERMAAAYAAKTWTDLRQLTGDLPVEPLLGTAVNLRPEPGLPQTVTQAALPQARRRNQPLGRLLWVVFAWILIAAALGSPDTAAALSVVYICLLACRVGYGGRG
jgi:hypothetical protein